MIERLCQRLCATALAVAPLASAWGDPLYKLTMIPARPPVGYMEPSAVNDLGHMAAYLDSGTAGAYGILMPNGRFIAEVPPAGVEQFQLLAINDADDCIGADLDGRGFVWSPARGWAWIRARQGDGAATPLAINNRGVVVGAVDTPQGRRPFTWRRGQVLRIIGDGRPGAAADINDLGVVLLHYDVDPAGVATDASALAYPGGLVVPIKPPRPHEGLAPVQVNLFGAVALNTYTYVDSTWQGWRWTPLGGLQPADGPGAQALSLDDGGHLLEARALIPVQYDLISPGHGPVPLMSLLTPDSRPPDFMAGLTRMSHNGTIAAGTNGGVLLFTPVAH